MSAIIRQGLGAAPIPDAPAGFYPGGTPQQVLAQMQIRAVGGLAFGLDGLTDNFASAHMSPPVAASMPMVKAIISSAAGGMNMSSLASAAQAGSLPTQIAQTVVTAVGAALDGALDIVQSIEAGQKASAVVEGASDAIPVIGAIVTWVVDAVAAVIGAGKAQAQLEDELEQQLAQALQQKCGSKLDTDRPYGTLTGGRVSPADFFRKLAYAYHERQQLGSEWDHVDIPIPLPFNASSMYVMLCGGETMGFGLTRDTYKAILDSERKRNPNLGIPGDVQRTMWRLIQGCFAMVQSPIALAPVVDQGRTLMPMLQDIIRQAYLDGQWDDQFARRLSAEVTGRVGQTVSAKLGAGVVQKQATCAGGKYGFTPFVDLSIPLIDSVVQYQALLVDTFWDAAKQDWSVAPLKGKISVGRRAALVLDPKLVQETSKAIRDAAGIRGWLRRNASGILLAVLAGGGAYYAGRRYRIGA